MLPRPLDYYTAPRPHADDAHLRVLRRLRRVCGFIALAAFIFSAVHSGDRDRLQWPSMFVFMGCLGLYLFTVIVAWVAGIEYVIRTRLRDRRRRASEQAGNEGPIRR